MSLELHYEKNLYKDLNSRKLKNQRRERVDEFLCLNPSLGRAGLKRDCEVI